MSSGPDTSLSPASRIFKSRPEGLRELSPRAIICGLVVAVIMGGSYPYVVLKLGFGPNLSVVAAIFGFIALALIVVPMQRLFGVRHLPYNRWENNIIQTAGTAAAQTAFMCILLAAFDMLRASKIVHFDIELSRLQSFAWLSCAAILGVLLAVPLRRHYIVDEKLPFPDGLAAGETILVCDSQGAVAMRAAVVMLLGMASSGLLMTLREDAHVLAHGFASTWVIPGLVTARTYVGLEWSLLAVGSGMIIGFRISLSMFIGTMLGWLVAPYALMHYGVLGPDWKKLDVLFWIMWPATGMLVAGGLTALLLRWRVLARTFKGLHASGGNDEFPLRWTAAGAVIAAVGLVLVQKFMIGQPVWTTVVAVLLSGPLALVCVRVLGETNWAPISALANMMQGVFALLAPGNIAANMIASGTTGTVASGSEAVMQDFKAGDMVGSSPRAMTIMQLLATPVGAAAVSWIYPVLREQYGFGDGGLSSPISRKWQGFAEILSQGTSALPPGAGYALLVGAILGVVLAVLESRVKNKIWVPSAAAVGIGMLVPASVIAMMFIGALVGAAWRKVHRGSSELYMLPLASGLIAGEAIVAVVVPVLIVLGILHV